MQLILWRHAEADTGSPDIERALTAAGIEQARRVAQWLKPRLPDDARILVSPARRTQQTAAQFKARFKTVEAIGPGASVTAVLAAAGAPAEGHTTLIVGHQPTLGEVAAWLMTGKALPWKLKKGGLIWLTWRGPEGRGRARLVAAITPDLA
jgi:phosphohistidine phosphatase